MAIDTRLEECIDAHDSASMSPLACEEFLQNIFVQHLKDDLPYLAVTQLFEFAFEFFYEVGLSLDVVLARDDSDGLQYAKV